MSISHEKESLFSLEVAVKTIYLKHAIICRVPKVTVRMLEYPPLEMKLLTDDELGKIKNIIEKEPESIAQSPQILQLQHSTGTYAFTQGQSMLVKETLSHLEEQLVNVPVYITVIDVLPDVPKLVASFALSLERCIRRIVQSISIKGIEIPCAHGERDIFPLYNLMGSKVGEAEMGVRLSSLGVNMLQHVSNIAKPETRYPVPFQVNTESTTILPPRKSQSVVQSKHQKILMFEEPDEISANDKEEDNKENIGRSQKEMKSGSTQTAYPIKYSKSVQYPVVEYEDASKNENVYCPPALYYDKRSDAMEKKLHLKQHLINSKAQDLDQSITLADLQFDPQNSINLPSRKISDASKLSHKEKSNDAQKHGTTSVTSVLTDFPILRALVEEVTRLGLKDTDNLSSTTQKRPDSTKKKQKPPKLVTRGRLSPPRKTPLKLPESKGPLKFGLTNTMRLRMAMSKDRKMHEASKSQQHKLKDSSRLSSKSNSDALGRTFTVKTSRGSKRVRLVSTACGPDNSMYRRHSTNVHPQTVYMGKMGGFEEGTDLDVPSIDHITPEGTQRINDGDDDYIEELMIVKDIGTPRAHSRQSQRSIEIHLPTASTEFTIGKDDDPDWASTFSDKERLLEKHRSKVVYDEDDSESYTPPVSIEESQPKSKARTQKGKKVVTISQSLEKSDIGSDIYKYSDDFEDDRTWSATHTPVVTPVASSLAVSKEEEFHQDAPIHARNSEDSKVTASYTSSIVEDQTGDYHQKLTITSDDAADTSSASCGSVVTALPATFKNTGERTLKYGNGSVPEPTPCDSPVIQSINTEDGRAEGFPVPNKVTLTSRSPTVIEKTPSYEVKLPKTLGDSKTLKRDVPTPKPSRFTPSPPTSRRYSPVSSPESSKERLRRMYHHPGRRHRNMSSESMSSDFDKPPSPVRRSDSVSSYLPSDLSEMSNIRMSEDLSDILSEDTDSQDESRSIKTRDYMPKDGPKTYFGKPKLDPSNKLGYTK